MKMKNQNTETQATPLTFESQSRLLAYTTAAGLGAFFADQNGEAQVVASTALAPYPHTLSKGAGTGYYKTYNYLDIDGDGTVDFNLNVDTFRVNIDKAANTQTNKVLNPSSNGYVIPWTIGLVLNSSSGYAPTYKNWLANSTFYKGAWTYAWNDFPTEEALGFSFTASDGLTHFGYMNVMVNHTAGANNDFTATVTGIYYNATANAAITIGELPAPKVVVTKISVGAGNSVTINFTSTDNAAVSAFTLQTSPSLGASATWAADAGAVITSTAPGVYQAVTTATAGPSQFYRVNH
jgi:hypothetical protein